MIEAVFKTCLVCKGQVLCQMGSDELPICTSHTVEEIRDAATRIRNESPHDESLVIRIYRHANKKDNIQPRKGWKER